MSILTDISENLQRGKAKIVKELVQQAIDEGMPVQQILDEGLLSGMNGVEDSLGGIESWYYIEVLRAGANSAAPIQSPEQARNALRAVTKDEVRDILRRLTLSVSYLLTKEDTAHAAE